MAPTRRLAEAEDEERLRVLRSLGEEGLGGDDDDNGFEQGDGPSDARNGLSAVGVRKGL